jgi:ABC-type glycerol-3-phosphate transport system substrate-binding protein/AraC-like DNA-binding protein
MAVQKKTRGVRSSKQLPALFGWCSSSQIEPFLKQKDPSIQWSKATSEVQRKSYLSRELSRTSTPLCVMNVSFREIQDFAPQGWLLPIDKYFNKKSLNSYSPTAVQHCSWNGRQYGIPEDVTTFGLVIRKDIWEQQNLALPKTWSDLDRALNLLSQSKKFPAITAKTLFVLNALGSNGINLSPGFDLLQFQSKTIEVYRWLTKFEAKWNVVKNSKASRFLDREAEFAFEKGEISCFFRPLSTIAGWPVEFQRQVSIIPFPRGPSKDHAFMTLHGHGWCVPVNTASPSRSIEVLRLVQNTTILKQTDLLHGYAFPAHREFWKDPQVIKQKPIYAFAQDLLSAREIFAPGNSQFHRSVGKIFTQALKHGYSEEKLIHELSAIHVKDVADRIQHPALKKALEFIEKSLHHIDDTQSVAKEAQLSLVGLNAIFQKEMHMSCSEYLKTARMKRARTLLADPHLFIKEISDQLGFDTPDAFGKVFKRYWNESPQDYRDKLTK